MQKVFRRAFIATLLMTAAHSAHAQFTVAGHVTLAETPGKSKKDIASALVWLVPVGITRSAPDTIPQHSSIAMRGREFLPHVRVVAVGGVVDFPNQDPF